MSPQNLFYATATNSQQFFNDTLKDNKIKGAPESKVLVDKKLGERYCFHRKKGKAETLTKLKYNSTESGDLEIEKGETEGKSVNMVCDRAIDKTGHPFECPHKSHYHGWNYRCLLNSQGHKLCDSQYCKISN